MFFSEQLLTDRGPLAQVWLAANLEKKLKRSDLLNTDIPKSVKAIVDSEKKVPMALRLSGQLLLGVVRIYGRQTGYLLDDCSHTVTKIKMTFKPGNVDLPTVSSGGKNTSRPPRRSLSVMLSPTWISRCPLHLLSLASISRIEPRPRRVYARQ